MPINKILMSVIITRSFRKTYRNTIVNSSILFRSNRKEVLIIKMVFKNKRKKYIQKIKNLWVKKI